MPCDAVFQEFRSSGVLKHRGTEVTEDLESEFHARISAVTRRPLCDDLALSLQPCVLEI